VIRSDYFFLTIILILLLIGCTNNKPINQSSVPVEQININHRIAVAHAAFKSQDFYEALTQWKILNTIDPENAEYKNRMRVLDALIKRRIKLHINNGKDALTQNKLISAEMAFLKVLALNPEHKFALKKLQEIDIKRSESIQKRKTAKLIERKKLQSLQVQEESHQDENSQESAYLQMGIEYFNQKDWNSSIREINKYLSGNPTDKTAKNYLFKAHIKLSELFEKRGHYEPAIQHMEDAFTYVTDAKPKQRAKLKYLQQKLASDYYIDGVKIYRDNISQAISLWQRALKYDPENKNIQTRLNNALEIQNKLKEIKK